MVKSCPIFDEAAKLGKASRITANFVRHFENWVAEGVASDVSDFNIHGRAQEFLPANQRHGHRFY